MAEATGKPDLGGVKRNGVTGLLPEVTWSEAFRERVVLMPSISSDFAARLAADLRARGARLFYGHSDFGFPPGHIEIDTRQLDGLRTFYRKVAAENEKIDLCIHCLAKQPVTECGRAIRKRIRCSNRLRWDTARRSVPENQGRDRVNPESRPA